MKCSHMYTPNVPMCPSCDMAKDVKISELENSLHKIRERLGDFDKEWSDREKDVDAIAKKALVDK